MISILIPVFNRDVNELVNALIDQVRLLQETAEIIVIDDGSEVACKKLNRKLAGQPLVRYIESDKNNGRVQTRQMLADTALYEWLLFLDCDSKIISPRFLETYLRRLSHSTQILAGGRVYVSERPSQCECVLHWQYGTHREKMRLKRNDLSNRFMTNNFFIMKRVFKKISFGSEWRTYGYEDTWMATQLEAMQVPVFFINNPVLHDGIETASVFLSKSEAALQNLKRLSRLVPQNVLIRHVKLYQYFCLFQWWRILWLVRVIYFFSQKIISRNLQSCRPFLTLFDLYRLNYFIRLTSAGEFSKTTDL